MINFHVPVDEPQGLRNITEIRLTVIYTATADPRVYVTAEPDS